MYIYTLFVCVLTGNRYSKYCNTKFFYRRLCLGAPSSMLPVLHHCLMHYSHPLASWLSKHDYELYGKSDLRFVEGVYKVGNEGLSSLSLHPPLPIYSCNVSLNTNKDSPLYLSIPLSLYIVVMSL